MYFNNKIITLFRNLSYYLATQLWTATTLRRKNVTYQPHVGDSDPNSLSKNIF